MNCLPADNSHEILSLTCFLKARKNSKCRLLQIFDGILSVNIFFILKKIHLSSACLAGQRKSIRTASANIWCRLLQILGGVLSANIFVFISKIHLSSACLAGQRKSITTASQAYHLLKIFDKRI